MHPHVMRACSIDVCFCHIRMLVLSFRFLHRPFIPLSGGHIGLLPGLADGSIQSSVRRNRAFSGYLLHSSAVVFFSAETGASSLASTLWLHRIPFVVLIAWHVSLSAAFPGRFLRPSGVTQQRYIAVNRTSWSQCFLCFIVEIPRCVAFHRCLSARTPLQAIDFYCTEQVRTARMHVASLMLHISIPMCFSHLSSSLPCPRSLFLAAHLLHPNSTLEHAIASQVFSALSLSIFLSNCLTDTGMSSTAIHL